VITWSQQQRRGDELAAVSALGEVLSQQQDYLGTGLELVVWSMPIDDSITERLDRLGAMIDDRPLTAHALAGALLTRLNRERDRIPLDLLRQSAATLASRNGLVSGLMALSLVRCAAAAPSGWAAARDRDVLRVLRRHPHADIRELALEHYTRAE
jgi:hypothetical protein